MKIKRIKITDFQSVRNSNEFEIGDVTCLVGKNESGKTALFQAIYRLNPIVESEGTYDVTNDYPRMDVEDYQQEIEQDKRKHATVAEVTFQLEENDLQPIQAALGPHPLGRHELVLKKGYSDKLTFTLKVNRDSALKHLLSATQLPPDTATKLTQCSSAEEALEILEAQEETEEANRLIDVLSQIQEKGLTSYIYFTHLHSKVPKLLYFDEYY